MTPGNIRGSRGSRVSLQIEGAAALLLAVIAVFATIRFRLRDVPLERDQGEYAYAGQLILQGIPRYQLAQNRRKRRSTRHAVGSIPLACDDAGCAFPCS